MSSLLRNTLLLISAASLALASSASERTLHWKALEVTAQLDAKGQLHVIEKQSIVFNGEWNGAERRFNIRNGQSVQLESLEEIDETTGARSLFQEGSLDSTQAWAWHTPTNLRWRARSPSDPGGVAAGEVTLPREAPSTIQRSSDSPAAPLTFRVSPV